MTRLRAIAFAAATLAAASHAHAEEAIVYDGVTRATPATAALFQDSTYQSETRDGMTAVISYWPNGECLLAMVQEGVGMEFADSCRYRVRDLGLGRIAMDRRVVFAGKPFETSYNATIRADRALVFDDGAVSTYVPPNGDAAR